MKEDILKSLSCYVPKYLLQRSVENINNEIIGQEEMIEGVVMIAELSGMNTIFEALAKEGKTGTDELRDICENYFNSVFNQVENFGGSVLYFGDKYLRALFPRGHGQQLATVVKKSVQCTLNIQEEMLNFHQLETSAGIFGLTMKTALTVGDIYHTVIGNRESEAKFIFAGEAFTEAQKALDHAIPGEVLISDYAIARGCGIELEEPKTTYSPIKKLTHPIKRSKSKPIKFSKLSARDKLNLIEYLSAYVPRNIYYNLNLKEDIQLGVRRRVAFLCLNFEGIEYEKGAVDKLQPYFVSIAQILEKLGGYILEILPSDNGGTFHIIFGAPIFNKDSEEQSIHCASQLMHLSEQFPDIKQKIGITTGFVYAGIIGNDVRKLYTVIGHSANLAFSIVNAAKYDQVWVDKYVFERTDDIAEFTKLDPIMMSGQSWPVQIYQLKKLEPHSTRALFKIEKNPLFDRENLIFDFYTIIHNTLQDKKQIISITGKEGSGKTRIAKELVNNARESGLVTFIGNPNYIWDKPYSIWESILTQFFELDASLPNRDNEGKLRKRIQMVNPELEELLPLLSDILSIKIEETKAIAALKTDERKERLFHLIKELLLDHFSRHATVLVFDDLSYADKLSLELLKFVIEFSENKSVIFVLICHDVAEICDLERYVDEPYFNSIKLERLAESGIVSLIKYFLNAHEIGENLKEFIINFASESPLFTEETLMWLKQTNRIVIHRQNGTQIADLTHHIDANKKHFSLEDLLKKRWKLLNSDEQKVLQRASIIGLDLPYSHLEEAFYPEKKESLEQTVYALSDKKFVALSQDEKSIIFTFKNTAIYDIVQDSLSESEKKRLHKQYIDFLEEKYEYNPKLVAFELAYHSEKAGDLKKQVVYFDMVGKIYERLGDMETARDYYERTKRIIDDPGSKIFYTDDDEKEKYLEIYNRLLDK